jgi:prepilin-type processing-associated H-X9-DG protein
MLFVVALMGAMLGMLLPALGGARESARAVVCASNIRQLQAVNDDFARDNDGRYVAGAPEIRERNLRRWHGERDLSNRAFDPTKSPLSGYLDGATTIALRECPSFIPTLESLADQGLGFERAAGGYGYNNVFVGTARKRNDNGLWLVKTDLSGSRRSRFSNPSMTIGFADAAFAGVRGLIEYSFVEPNYWPEYEGYRADPSAHFRHGHGTNVAWLDGHVSGESRTRSAAGYSSRLDSQALGLGWFGQADDNRLFDYE